jgi:hypothetical protein
MIPTTYDLPTGPEIEEAWRRVEAVLRSRRRTGDRRPVVAVADEQPTCFPR